MFMDFLQEGVDDGRLGQVFVSRGRGRGFRFPIVRFPIAYPLRPYAYYPQYPQYPPYPPPPAPAPAPAGTCINVTSNGQTIMQRCFVTAPSDADIDLVAAQIKQL